jgi:hypothetical protein
VTFPTLAQGPPPRRPQARVASAYKTCRGYAGEAPAGTGLTASRFLGGLMTNEKLAESIVGMLRSGVGPGAASQVTSRGNEALGGRGNL